MQRKWLRKTSIIRTDINWERQTALPEDILRYHLLFQMDRRPKMDREKRKMWRKIIHPSLYNMPLYVQFGKRYIIFTTRCNEHSTTSENDINLTPT